MRGIPWEGDEVSVFSGVSNNIKWRNLEKKEDRENARVMTPILHYLSLFVRIQNIGVHPDALEWLRTKNQRTQVDGMVQSSAAISGTVTIFFIELYSVHIPITFKLSHYYFYAPELQECSKFAKLANS